jgi:hypothetical protein
LWAVLVLAVREQAVVLSVVVAPVEALAAPSLLHRQVQALYGGFVWLRLLLLDRQV